MKHSPVNRWSLGVGVALAGALGWSFWVQPWTVQSGNSSLEERLPLELRGGAEVSPREVFLKLQAGDRGKARESASSAQPSGAFLELLQKGRTALEKREFEKAREAYEQALALEGDEKRALSALAWLEQRDRNWERSEELVRRALKLAVDDAALWLSLGVALLEQEKLEAATAAFCQTTALDPKNARARRMLALTLGRRGWMDGAEQEFRKAIELEPEDGGAHYNLALLYLERKPPLLELGRRHYYRAVDLGVAADVAIETKLNESQSR